ncbi:MAG TPA: permease prefix domain 1-containing protein, partial [Woeseiaceae bacterium]|nr:permease prefix domain 1-containing protein [Woeseiaceae bacterium]
MRRVRALLARLLNSLLGSHARRFDADLRAELESHLNMQIEDNLRRGLPPDEARRQALLAAGGLTAAAESVREQRGLPWLDHAKQDVVY